VASCRPLGAFATSVSGLVGHTIPNSPPPTSPARPECLSLSYARTV